MQDIPVDKVPDIIVNVDITPDQIQPDSGNSLQVALNYTSQVESYTSPDGTVITGTGLIKTTSITTSLSDLQGKSDVLGSQISSLQDQKNAIDALIPTVTNLVTTSINNLQVQRDTPISSPAEMQPVS